jgi:hypothetical protein
VTTHWQQRNDATAQRRNGMAMQRRNGGTMQWRLQLKSESETTTRRPLARSDGLTALPLVF